MIASLRGTVLSVALDSTVVEVGGVGMAVRATPATLAGLKRGETAYLATTLVVREDSLTLYGFASDDARDLFVLVQSVTGVGPRIALAMLAVFAPDELRATLSAGDAKALTRVPGIGQKGADRLVLELRDKVAAAVPSTSTAAGTTAAVPPWRDKLVDALTGLGWTARQAGDAVVAVTRDGTDPAVGSGEVSVLLRRALSVLGGKR